MDPILGLDGGFDNFAAFLSAVGVLVAVCLVLEHMIGLMAGTADAIRGRDRCHYCGSSLPTTADGLGHTSRCRDCERSQPWSAGR